MSLDGESLLPPANGNVFSRICVSVILSWGGEGEGVPVQGPVPPSVQGPGSAAPSPPPNVALAPLSLFRNLAPKHVQTCSIWTSRTVGEQVVDIQLKCLSVSSFDKCFLVT